MTYIYALLFACVLGAIFAISTYLNSKTAKPEGCEQLTESCHGCSITSCSHHPANNDINKEGNNHE